MSSEWNRAGRVQRGVASRAHAPAPVRDRALVARLQEGDRLAFERLYREHAGDLHGYCRRLTRDPDRAADLVQESFARLLQRLPQIEAGRINVAAYLHRTARNLFLSERRGPQEISDEDVWDASRFVGSTHVTREERTRLERVLEAGGLVDAYRALHPDEVGFTWWDYRQGHFHRKLGLRIDLALLSADLAGRLTACGIDRGYRKGSKPSDHAPLLVDVAD